MLIVFPKGGVRFLGLPITWGYLLLFISFLLLLPYRMLIVRARYVRRQIFALACLVPFALVFFYTLFAFGVDGSYARNGVVSTSISLIALPILFLWYYPPMLSLLDRDQLLKCIRYCILITAIFGIFQFFWRPLAGFYLQIPYLTANGDDLADLATTRNNARGFFFKLIATYNNGNIYGAATLILLRVYDYATPKRWQRWTVRVALFLTLSRTIWAGLLFNELLTVGALLLEQLRNFPRLRLGRAAKVTFSLVVLAPFFLLAVQVMNRAEASFLFDPTLGGRTSQFQQLGSVSFFPTVQSPFQFTEVVYLAAINLFGYVGFISVTLILLSPVAILLMDRTALQDPLRRAAFKGLILYALICTSDGALGLIPVICFYWFTYMIYLFGLPGARPAHTEQQETEPVPSISLRTPLST